MDDLDLGKLALKFKCLELASQRARNEPSKMPDQITKEADALWSWMVKDDAVQERIA